jgi:flagellar hook protein FlgE
MPLPAVSLSGMKAAQSGLSTSAHNLANLSTTGFRRDRVIQTSLPSGGVTVSVGQTSQAGHATEADVVGQLEAKNLFLANLAVFKTTDQILGSLLDITS